MASNMMELMKSKFSAMSRAELSLTARSANDNLVIGLMSGDLQNMLLVADYTFVKKCLKLGFCTRSLSQKQKWLINELFPHNYQNTVETITAAAIEAITDDDYKLIGAFADKHPQVSEAMFNLLMCAAYADGGLKKEVEDRIDPIFGMLFLALFADSGLESVPAPAARRPRVAGLEARVLDYMLKQNTMLPLNDIVKAFPGETKTSIKKALDGLCEKDLVHWYSNVILEPYSVEVDRDDVDIILSDVKTETREEKAKREKEEAERFIAELKAEAERKTAERRAAREAKMQREEEERKAYKKAVDEWK